VATISLFLCYSALQTDQNIGAVHFAWFGSFLSTIGRALYSFASGIGSKRLRHDERRTMIARRGEASQHHHE
jgi:hypothetical protein